MKTNYNEALFAAILEFIVTVPKTEEIGGYSHKIQGLGLESILAEALQHYNQRRKAPGLKSSKKMPNGTTYTRVKK